MIVIPGDYVGKGEIENTYGIGEHRYSKFISLRKTNNRVKITRFESFYIPKLNDVIIGKVIDVLPNGWVIDINSPYLGFLLVKDTNIGENMDLNDLYTYEDFLLCKIYKISKNKIINLTVKEEGLGKLEKGVIISVNPVRLPRVIGKKGSMLNILKEMLKVNIIIGNNGRVFISGDKLNVLRTISVIEYIIKNSYKKGLTEKVKEMIEKGRA